MKRLTGIQKLSTVVGAGLLIAAASGSVFAMHTAEDRDMQQHQIRQETEYTPLDSPLPTPTLEPTSEPHDVVESTGVEPTHAGRHDDGNSNSTGNVNSSDNHGNDTQGNMNSNEDHANSNNHHDNSNHHDGNNNVNSNDNHSNSNDKHSSGGNDQHGDYGNGN